jgi:hypothetical protein
MLRDVRHLNGPAALIHAKRLKAAVLWDAVKS